MTAQDSAFDAALADIPTDLPEAMAIIAPAPTALEQLARSVEHLAATTPLVRTGGMVVEAAPTHLRIVGLSQSIRLGDCVSIESNGQEQAAEVVRIDANGAAIKPFDIVTGAGVGTPVWRRGPLEIAPHTSWKGRAINAMGAPIDGAGPLLKGPIVKPIDREPPAAMKRARVKLPIRTGVRVIDLFTPLSAGQRIGIFAGSGVRKSTTLSMLTRATGFDTVVVALVGERGREVREFLEDALGSSRQRSIAVVSTGDESPMMRRLAPRTAMCVAEHFRDEGENVLLIVDSVTRYAHAARDVALAAGEPPVARGYTPSVFSDLPKLLERAGPGEEGTGSITGIFSVLVDGDDHNDPVADSIRGTLDGHIVLDRAIADQGRYPAVNVLTSVSRLAHNCWTPDERKTVLRLKSLIARYEETRDLRLMGGYHSGSDPELDKAIEIVPKLMHALQQAPDDPPSLQAFQEIARALSAPAG